MIFLLSHRNFIGNSRTHLALLAPPKIHASHPDQLDKIDISTAIPGLYGMKSTEKNYLYYLNILNRAYRSRNLESKMAEKALWDCILDDFN